jgi:hypothetical protein
MMKLIGRGNGTVSVAVINVENTSSETEVATWRSTETIASDVYRDVSLDPGPIDMSQV